MKSHDIVELHRIMHEGLKTYDTLQKVYFVGCEKDKIGGFITERKHLYFWHRMFIRRNLQKLARQRINDVCAADPYNEYEKINMANLWSEFERDHEDELRNLARTMIRRSEPEVQYNGTITEAPANIMGVSRHLFWNVIGSVILGFSSFVLSSNLIGLTVATIKNIPADQHIWATLSDGTLPIYGIFLITVFGMAIIITGRRVLAKKIMSHIQAGLVLAPGFLYIITDYLYRTPSITHP